MGSGGGPQQPLIDTIKTTQAQSSLSQLVDKDTCIQFVYGVYQHSIIDHSNCREKLGEVEVMSVGDSGYLGLIVSKLTKVPQKHLQTYPLQPPARIIDGLVLNVAK